MNERDQELLEQAGVGDTWNKADWYSMSPKMIEKFADLIRADEREACANIAENWNCNGSPRVGVAAQIRAKGNT